MATVSLRFSADDPRLHTMTGEKRDGVIRLRSGPGFGLFGPYISLPTGQCVARIRFSGQPRGRAVMDICTDAGRTVLASRAVDLDALGEEGRSVELAATLDGPCSECEIRLLCEPGVDADIESLELELTRFPDTFLRPDQAGEPAGGAGEPPARIDPSMRGRVFDLKDRQLVELDGVSLYVMPNDFIGAGIIASGSYEPHVTAVIRNRLKKPGAVFVDIGANIGYFTMLASRIAARVIAFEPNPQNLELIRASVEHSKVKNVTLHPYALSDCARDVRLFTVGSNGAIVTALSLIQDSNITARAVTGDSLLGGEPRIDLMKMDVELHEAMALRGLERTIRRHRPEIIFEYHPFAMRRNNPDPRPERLLDQIVDYGYVLSIIMPDGTLRPTWPSEVSAYRLSLKPVNMHLDLFASPIPRDPSKNGALERFRVWCGKALASLHRR